MNLTITKFNRDAKDDQIFMFVTPDETVTIEIGEAGISIAGGTVHDIDEPMPVITEVPQELACVLWTDAITLYPFISSS